MNVEIAAEPFANWWGEAGKLFVAHWEEVGLFRDRIELEVDVLRIVELERAGAWLAWTVRDAGLLVGYACVLVSMHLHYASHRFGLVDVVYLRPEYRGAGLGARLIGAVEQGARAAGCSRLVLHVKLAHDFGPLLERSGYVATETNWERLL